MRFLIFTFFKHTPLIQGSSSSRIYRNKAMLWQYFVSSSIARHKESPPVCPRASTWPLKARVFYRSIFRALAKSNLQLWPLRELEEVLGEVCNAPPASVRYLKPVSPAQGGCISQDTFKSQLQFSTLRCGKGHPQAWDAPGYPISSYSSAVNHRQGGEKILTLPISCTYTPNALTAQTPLSPVL